MNSPTLCLVLDGERIVSYAIHTSDKETAIVRHDLSGTAYTLRTIPLSLCALAPEMKEFINQTLCRIMCLRDDARNLLSRLNTADR